MELSTRTIGRTIIEVTVKSGNTTITEDVSSSRLLKVEESDIDDFFSVGIDLCRFNRKSDLDIVKDFILFIDLSKNDLQELFDEFNA